MGKDETEKKIRPRSEGSEAEDPIRGRLDSILPSEPEQILETIKSKPLPIDEEAYTAAVSKIIQRDFFPDLPKLRLQVKALSSLLGGNLDPAYYDALVNTETEDDYKIPLGPSQSTELHGQTIAPFERTPAPSDIGTVDCSTASSAGASSRIKDPGYIDVAKMSLTMLQNRYTSDDNASFSELMERKRLEDQQKYKRIYDRERNNLRLADTPSSERLLLCQPNTVDAWRAKVKNTLMYYPEGCPLTKYDPVDTRTGHKKIVFEATGFKQPFPIRWPRAGGCESQTSSPSQSGPGSMRSESPGSSPTAHKNKESGGITKEYGYVSSTPILVPGVDVNPGELMTWGNIESTPVPLEDTPVSRTRGPAYEILPTSRRELLGHKLSERLQKSPSRAQQRKVYKYSIFESPCTPLGSTSTTASSFYNSGQRTPATELSLAAQNLLHRIKSGSIKSYSNKNVFPRRADRTGS